MGELDRMGLIRRDELHLHRIQKLTDAFEDAGLYNPDPDTVEAIYEDAVFPLTEQLRGAVEENKRLRAAMATDERTIADLRRQVAASDEAIRDHFARERGQ